jgi:hypothetical protein
VLYERPATGGRGGLRVLLTTRSKELRSHPGQTALPGGKMDKTDAGVVETAVSIFLSKICCPHLLHLNYRYAMMRDGAGARLFLVWLMMFSTV